MLLVFTVASGVASGTASGASSGAASSASAPRGVCFDASSCRSATTADAPRQLVLLPTPARMIVGPGGKLTWTVPVFGWVYSPLSPTRRECQGVAARFTREALRVLIAPAKNAPRAPSPAEPPPAAGRLGGSLGALATKEQPVPLERALREELARYGAQLVSTYRYGPARVQVLFKYQDQFWTVESSATLHGGQDEIDDWLFGDLVDYQFKARLEEIQRGHR